MFAGASFCSQALVCQKRKHVLQQIHQNVCWGRFLISKMKCLERKMQTANWTMLLRSGKDTLLWSWKHRVVLPHPRGTSLPLPWSGAPPVSLLGLLHVERQLGEHMVAQPKPGFNSDLPHPGWVPTSTEMLLYSHFLSADILGRKEYATVVPLTNEIHETLDGPEKLFLSMSTAQRVNLNTCPWTYVQQLLRGHFSSAEVCLMHSNDDLKRTSSECLCCLSGVSPSSEWPPATAGSPVQSHLHVCSKKVIVLNLLLWQRR